MVRFQRVATFHATPKHFPKSHYKLKTYSKGPKARKDAGERICSGGILLLLFVRLFFLWDLFVWFGLVEYGNAGHLQWATGLLS